MDTSQLKILNLFGDLPESVTLFLESMHSKIVTRSEINSIDEVDYIIITTQEQLTNLNKDYELNSTEVPVICFSPVKHNKTFLLNNGRLTIDIKSVQSKLGKVLIQNFIEKKSSLHISDLLGEFFNNTKNFSVTNHTMAGYYSDEVSLEAFEQGFNLVGIRTFIDHIIYYFSYLKQAKIATAPFEFEYAYNDQNFSVSTHCIVRDFLAEYLIDSFGDVNSNNPLSYLLAIVNASSEYLEIVYLEESSKLIFNAYWSKNQSHQLLGMSLSNIQTSAQALSSVESKLEEYNENATQQLEQRQQQLASKVLPGGIDEFLKNPDPESILSLESELTKKLFLHIVRNYPKMHPDSDISEITMEQLEPLLETFEDQNFIAKLTFDDKDFIVEKLRMSNLTKAYQDQLERVRSSLRNEDEHINKISGTLLDEISQKVSGGIEADQVNKILGSKEESPENMVVKGKRVKEKKFKQVIKGTKKEKDDFLVKVKSAFENNLSDEQFNDGLSVELLESFISKMLKGLDSLPYQDEDSRSLLKDYVETVVREELYNFSQDIEKDLESLNKEDLEQFHHERLTYVLSNLLNDQEKINDYINRVHDEMDHDFKEKGIVEEVKDPFMDLFRSILEKGLDDIGYEHKQDGNFIITEETLNEDVKKVILESINKAVIESHKLSEASLDKIEEYEKSVITDILIALGLDPNLFNDVNKKVQEKELESVLNHLEATSSSEHQATGSFTESELAARLKESQQENKKLQSMINALKLKNAADNELKKTLDKANEEINAVSQEELDEFLSISSDDFKLMSQDELEKYIKKLKEGSLTEQESEALAKHLEEQMFFLERAKDMERIIKKVKHDSDAREIVLQNELSSSLKTIKAKDFAIDNAKKSLQNAVTKYEIQVKQLEQKVSDLNQRLETDQSTQLAVEVKRLTGELVSVQRTADVYKNKLEVMAKKYDDIRASQTSSNLSGEMRVLERAKIELENKLNAQERLSRQLESRLEKSQELERSLQSQVVSLKSSTKELENENRILKDNQKQIASNVDKASGEVEAKLNKEIEVIKNQNAQLQAKLKEVIEKSAKTAGNEKKAASGTAKEKHLEKQLKRLQEEYAKATKGITEQKKEVVKLKSENTALTHENQALKKEVAKYKGKKKSAA